MPATFNRVDDENQKESQHHLVIGGGVIGLCTAYFLAREGRQVTVVDRNNSTLQESCSDRNAGMIVPSHFIPLAAPGVIWQGLKWMLNRRSPFYLRPRIDPALWSWCWQFARCSNQRHVDNCRELLRDISLESRALMVELSEDLGFSLTKRGLVMLCQSEAGLHEESRIAEQANEIGIEAEVCSPGRLRELDSDVDMSAVGGVWFPQDCHLDPEQFLAALRRGISKLGGQFIHGEIERFHFENNQITHAVTSQGERIQAYRFTIAAGAWSSALGKQLGLNLPMQAGKGYSFTITNPVQLPQLCSLLKEGRVAVTPMGRKLRVAGTMEICGNDLSIDRTRLEGIIDSFCQFFPQFETKDFKDLEPWVGLRPCTPDGLPYIGRAPRAANVMVATGHSMLGLSLGAVTGKMIAETDRVLDSRFSPERY